MFMKSTAERGDLVPSFEGEERKIVILSVIFPRAQYTNDFSTSRCQEERFYVGLSTVYNVTKSPFLGSISPTFYIQLLHL
jgi:hypothetical protein